MKINFKIIFIILILLTAFFVLNIFSSRTKGFFYLISSPIQKTLWTIGDSSSNFLTSIVNIKNLKNETEQMKIENQELLSELVDLIELKKENEFLKEAFNIGLNKNFELIMVQIISKDISSDFILIDKGKADKVKTDMPIITQQKVLVGRISEVYNNFSKVMLISNKDNSFDIEIQRTDEENIKGILRGKENFKIILDFIPFEKEISEKDIVITSSLGGLFPAGLLVGKVKRLVKSDVKSFQQAEIEPFFDITEINYLFIITDY